MNAELVLAAVLLVMLVLSLIRDETRVLYFAYGVNTNTAYFKKRVPTAQYRGKATLEGYDLEKYFHFDIVQKPNSQVVGVLWELPLAHIPQLDKDEKSYVRKTVRVFTNRWVEAETYIMDRDVQETNYFKTNKTNYENKLDRYFRRVKEGYKKNNLPMDQLMHH